MNKPTKDILVLVFLWMYIFISFGKIYWHGISGTCCIFQSGICSLKWLNHFTFSQLLYEGSFLYTLDNNCYYLSFDYIQLSRFEVISHSGSNLHFPVGQSIHSFIQQTLLIVQYVQNADLSG